MSHDTPIQLERIFKSVANRKRIAILRYLKKQRHATVGSIAAHIKLSLSATSRHLDILERAGFLVDRQRGLEVYYKINRDCDPATRDLLRIIV